MGFGGIVVLPAGWPRERHLERRGEVRHLHLYLDPALVQGIAAGTGLDPEKAELVEALDDLLMLAVGLVGVINTASGKECVHDNEH